MLTRNRPPVTIESWMREPQQIYKGVNMNPARAMIIASLAAATILALSSADGKKQEVLGTVVGRVLAPDGKPIAGARVWFNKHDSVPEGKTDDKGRFQIGPT